MRSEACRPNFGLTAYPVKSGVGTTRYVKEYLMDRKGFVLLVMGFIGEKALKFKSAYIDEFDRMETELQRLGSVTRNQQEPSSSPFPIPQTLKEALHCSFYELTASRRGDREERSRRSPYQGKPYREITQK